MRKDFVPDKSPYSLLSKAGRLSAITILMLGGVQTLLATPIATHNATIRLNRSIQAVKLSGKVTDENGQPLPGVTVQVKRVTNMTQTDAKGDYTLQVPDNSNVIVFSMVGFDSQEILLNGRTAVNVQLKPSNNALNDVVVVGYGTQKKKDVTGSVVSANLEDFRNSPNTNLVQSLQGTVPGLNVGQVNSAGATPTFSIRGSNTLNGNSRVLIVLDGVQYNGSFESLNPDDIASVDVLKDASATAVYGAQAANGVLLITSRRGKKGERPRISYSGSYATQTPTGNIRPMNREQYLKNIRDQYWREAFLAPTYTQPNPAFDIRTKADPSLKNAAGELLPNDFSWYDAATRTGGIMDHQVSISGATEKVNYLFSLNYTNQKGVIRGDDFKRKGVRVNLETQITSWWKGGIQSFGSFVNKDGAEPSMGAIMQQSPLILPFDANGKLVPNPFNTNVNNPFQGYYTEDLDRHNYFFANLYSEINFPFLKGLSYRINFGNNYRTEQAYNASIYGAQLNGTASKEINFYYDYTLDNIVTYTRAFNKHDINLTLLYGSIERKNDYTLSNANTFPRLTLGYNALEVGINQFANSDAWNESLAYQMARINYKYNDRYLLTATLRRDGFSGFAANNKYALFPSMALGWIATNESFMKMPWLDYLKVRAGYGVAGNQTDRYSSLSRIGSNAAYVFGDGGTPLFGQQLNSLPNPNLRWERTTGLNAGIDFTLFKDRLSGSIDYYQTTTRDLLYDINIPNISGFNTIRTNVGKMANKGIEVALNSRNLQIKDFRWRTTLSFSRNVNKILSILGTDANGDGIEDDLPASGLFIGKSKDTLFGYEANGIYQIGEIPPAGYQIGSYRVVDQNGDGVITLADRKVLGHGEPAYRISLLNAFEYKGFSLSVFLNSVQGGKNNYRGANSPSMSRSDNSLRNNYISTIDYWSPLNPGAKYARSELAPTITPTLYQDRSFIRLQDVSLSYRFSGTWVNKLKLQNLNVYVSGKNLATWTKWEGWDPEVPGQGLTNDGRPVLKGYAFGINATF